MSDNPLTAEPGDATMPENSCLGTGCGLSSPVLVCVVGYRANSVGVTPAARTRTKICPAAGTG